MCAIAIGLSSGVRGRAVNHSRLRSVITTGVATGLVSVVAFGIAHALAIVPIWAQLARGCVPAIVGGIALSWAFEQLVRQFLEPRTFFDPRR